MDSLRAREAVEARSGGSVNLCSGCREDFGSVAAFDAHRVGSFAYTFSQGLTMDSPRDDGRRCLGIDELEQSALFVRNKAGRWSLQKSIAWGAASNSRAHKRRGERAA